MSDTIVIDNAGRLVLPKPLRDQFRLKGGSKLRVETVGDHLELTPLDSGDTPSLLKKDGLLVIPATGEAFDALDAVRLDRESREDSITGA